MAQLITATNLTILRGHTPILRQHNISVEEGQVIHLSGDNGSGKTTLLQALAGLLTAQSGNIERHSDMLYLGHRPGIKAALTARENLQLIARLYHRMPRQSLDARINHALEQVGLERISDRPTRQLSAGQQRRCQLARLWLDTPPLWLLDEPLTALDVHAIARLGEHCANHLDNGGGIIVTSHQPFPIPRHSLCHHPLT